MRAKLIVVGGDAKAAVIPVRLPTTIGRGRGATLRLPHPLVSRTHCELYESNNQLYVRDLGSLNGTYVGNQRVSEAALPPGELLTLGSITFRVMYNANPVSDDTDLSTKDPDDPPAHVSESPEPAVDGELEHEALNSNGGPGGSRRTELQIRGDQSSDAKNGSGQQGLFFGP